MKYGLPVVLLMTLFGCDGDTPQDTENPLTGFRGTLTATAGLGELEHLGTDLRFGADAVRISTACNLQDRTYVVHQGLLVTELAFTTLMGCDDGALAREAALVAVLDAAPVYTLDGSVLTLRSDDTLLEYTEAAE